MTAMLDVGPGPWPGPGYGLVAEADGTEHWEPSWTTSPVSEPVEEEGAEMSRPGPRMLEVAAYVAEHPGCCKTEAAHGIGQQNHNYGQGFGPIDRAIRAGLVEAVKVHAKRYALYPPDTQYWTPAEPEPDGHWRPAAHP